MAGLGRLFVNHLSTLTFARGASKPVTSIWTLNKAANTSIRSASTASKPMMNALTAGETACSTLNGTSALASLSCALTSHPTTSSRWINSSAPSASLTRTCSAAAKTRSTPPRSRSARTRTSSQKRSRTTPPSRTIARRSHMRSAHTIPSPQKKFATSMVIFLSVRIRSASFGLKSAIERHQTSTDAPSTGQAASLTLSGTSVTHTVKSATEKSLSSSTRLLRISAGLSALLMRTRN